MFECWWCCKADGLSSHLSSSSLNRLSVDAYLPSSSRLPSQFPRPTSNVASGSCSSLNRLSSHAYLHSSSSGLPSVFDGPSSHNINKTSSCSSLNRLAVNTSPSSGLPFDFHAPVNNFGCGAYPLEEGYQNGACWSLGEGTNWRNFQRSKIPQKQFRKSELLRDDFLLEDDANSCVVIGTTKDAVVKSRGLSGRSISWKKWSNSLVDRLPPYTQEKDTVTDFEASTSAKQRVCYDISDEFNASARHETPLKNSSKLREFYFISRKSLPNALGRFNFRTQNDQCSFDNEVPNIYT